MYLKICVDIYKSDYRRNWINILRSIYTERDWETQTQYSSIIEGFYYLGVHIDKQLICRLITTPAVVKNTQQYLYGLKDCHPFHWEPSERLLYQNCTRKDCMTVKRLVCMGQHLSGFKLPCLHKLNSQWCFRQVLIVCTIPTEFTQQPFIIDALWFNRNSQLTLQLTSQKNYEKKS